MTRKFRIYRYFCWCVRGERKQEGGRFSSTSLQMSFSGSRCHQKQGHWQMCCSSSQIVWGREESRDWDQKTSCQSWTEQNIPNHVDSVRFNNRPNSNRKFGWRFWWNTIRRFEENRFPASAKLCGENRQRRYNHKAATRFCFYLQTAELLPLANLT